LWNVASPDFERQCIDLFSDQYADVYEKKNVLNQYSVPVFAGAISETFFSSLAWQELKQ
jgi:hypothetical protein